MFTINLTILKVLKKLTNLNEMKINYNAQTPVV